MTPGSELPLVERSVEGGPSASGTGFLNVATSGPWHVAHTAADSFEQNLKIRLSQVGRSVGSGEGDNQNRGRTGNSVSYHSGIVQTDIGNPSIQRRRSYQ